MKLTANTVPDAETPNMLYRFSAPNTGFQMAVSSINDPSRDINCSDVKPVHDGGRGPAAAAAAADQ